MDIFKMLNNNTAGLSDEEKLFVENFNDNLKEKLTDELVKYEIEELIKEAKGNEEVFKQKIENIFLNGYKGYKNMPLKTLIDIFLDKKNEGDFMYLIESMF